MDPTQLTAEQLQYAAIVSAWWFALLKKAAVTFIAYEFTLWMSRRLDKRAGRTRGFKEVLEEIRQSPNAGLGQYYGLRELGRCVFLAAVVCYS
jgi:hypothetical protein